MWDDISPASPRLWEKLFRIQAHVFLSSGSCMNENVVFIDNIFRSLCSHFVGLSSPTHSFVHPKEKFFWQETNYLTLYCISWAGSICRELATLLPHGSIIVMWSITVSSLYFHEPIMVLIFLYSGQEPMVSAVASSIRRTELSPFLGGGISLRWGE